MSAVRPFPVQGSWTPRPLAGLWRWVNRMFIAVLASEVLYFVVLAAAWSAYYSIPNPTESQLVRWLSYAGWTVGALSQAALSVANFLFLRLFYRAMKNARGMAPQLVTRSPGWTIAWNFIPVVNVWRPFGAMVQVWQASDPEALRKLPLAMIGWWAMWVLYWVMAAPLVLLGETGGSLADVIGGAEPYKTFSLSVGVVATAALAASIGLAMVFLPTLVRRQDERIQAIAFE